MRRQLKLETIIDYFERRMKDNRSRDVPPCYLLKPNYRQIMKKNQIDQDKVVKLLLDPFIIWRKNYIYLTIIELYRMQRFNASGYPIIYTKLSLIKQVSEIGFPYLTSLQLERCGITSIQLFNRTQMPVIEYINLRDNYIRSIKDLRKLQSIALTSLHLQKNEIKDIQVLAQIYSRLSFLAYSKTRNQGQLHESLSWICKTNHDYIRYYNFYDHRNRDGNIHQKRLLVTLKQRLKA